MYHMCSLHRYQVASESTPAYLGLGAVSFAVLHEKRHVGTGMLLRRFQWNLILLERNLLAP